MLKETTEKRTEARPQPGEQDAAFTGVARHPLARRWLRRRLKDEVRSAAQASGEEREAHKAKAAELRGMLRPEPKR